VGTSGTYDIGSISLPCDGPQVLRIKADNGETGDFQRYYYLEYRTPIGIDKTNGVLVHYSADIKKGGWTQCDWGGPDCPEDYLINPIGSTRQDALFPAGTQWTTPQGVGIKIVSLGETATFELSFPTPGDGPTCLDGEAWDCKAPVCKGSTGNVGTGGGAPSGCTADAGTTDAGGGTTTDSGTGTGGSGGTGGSDGTGGATTGAGGTAGDESGCNCSVPGQSASRGWAALTAAAALATGARWRRRSRAKTRS
jgi:MYXO-CTERM domain-containing protein